jgi:hypothetical protein
MDRKIRLIWRKKGVRDRELGEGGQSEGGGGGMESVKEGEECEEGGGV